MLHFVKIWIYVRCKQTAGRHCRIIIRFCLFSVAFTGFGSILFYASSVVICFASFRLIYSNSLSYFFTLLTWRLSVVFHNMCMRLLCLRQNVFKQRPKHLLIFLIKTNWREKNQNKAKIAFTYGFLIFLFTILVLMCRCTLPTNVCFGDAVLHVQLTKKSIRIWKRSKSKSKTTKNNTTSKTKKDEHKYVYSVFCSV